MDFMSRRGERARKPNASCHPHSSPSRTTIKHSEVLKDPPLFLLPHSPTTLLASHTLGRPAEWSQRKRETETEKRKDEGFRRTIGTSNAKSDWRRCTNFEVFLVPLKYLSFAYGRNRSQSLKLRRDNGLDRYFHTARQTEMDIWTKIHQ